MHKPRPRGQLAVGGEPTADDAKFIELVARRLTNLRALSGLTSMRMVKALPDGGYVIAQDMGGVFKCITHKPNPSIEPKNDFDGVAQTNIPMLFSGTVTRAIVAHGQGVEIRVTNQTRKRVVGYNGSARVPERIELQRFKVSYHHLFHEFQPKNPGPWTYTQYVQQRPTWYSGAMAEVMQVVGGYGRQDFNELPKDLCEQAQMVLPQAVARKVEIEIGNVRLPGYTGRANTKGQFCYDYKFYNTHAVSFDAENRPWLIQVSLKGVYAMPLPLIPATTTLAFREYITEQGDHEIEKILDRFGGMPSGESFPIKEEDFEAWRRAGVIIKVCDSADFYSHIAYSTACGWSFNAAGSEAYNTCYDYYDDEGLGYGLTYKLSLSLGAAENDGKLPQTFNIDDHRLRAKLNRYLSGLYRLMSRDNRAKHLAIKYKIRRVDIGLILQRLDFDPDSSELDYWDSLELGSIANHSGSVSEVGRGYLYHGAKFMYQPQIKYPEPFLGGCVSHDFLPLINGRGKDEYPNCDTIMFCYFVGNDLKVVKYFRDGRDFQRYAEDNYEECMIVGAWERTEYHSRESLLGHFYTSDIDQRVSVTGRTTRTNIVGQDKGYDHTPWFEFDAPFWKPGTIWRNRYFTHEVTTVSTDGRSISTAICVPYFNRNSVIHAKRDFTYGRLKSESGRLMYVRDPTSYRYWTYDFVMHWAGSLPVMNGKPFPKDGSPVWVEIEEYYPGPCSDFADQGSWIPGLPADYTWLVHPEADVWQLNGGGGVPSYKDHSETFEAEDSKEGRLDFCVFTYPRLVHKNVPDTMYFMGSPDPYLGVFYRDASRVVFGDSEYANVSEQAGGRRKFWGNSKLVDHKSAHNFIGVINE